MGNTINQQTPICQQEELGEMIACYDDAVKADYRGLRMGRRKDVAKTLNEAFDEVGKKIRQERMQDVLDSEEVRMRATMKSREIGETLRKFSLRTDVQALLSDYAEAYRQYNMGCGSLHDARREDGDSVSCAVLDEKLAAFSDEIADIPSRSLGLDYVKHSLRLSPFAYYSTFDGKAGLGGGLGLEFLSRVGTTHVAVGAETKALAYRTHDAADYFSGELKTTDFSFVPPLFEIGYQNDNFTAVIEGGLWFNGYGQSGESAAKNPYSNKLFENPNFQAGVKTYLFGNRVRAAAGYQQSPWGSGGVAELGYSFGGKRI